MEPFIEIREQSRFAIELLTIQQGRVEYLDGPRHLGEFVGALLPIDGEIEVALRQAQHRVPHPQHRR